LKLLDRDHPMFRRLWVRWLTVLLPAAWGGFEGWLGNPGWAVLFLLAAGYAAWELFIRR
jgi:hypothetical protein